MTLRSEPTAGADIDIAALRRSTMAGGVLDAPEPAPHSAAETPALEVGPVLAKGGMSVIRLAHQGELDRGVVVKQLPPEGRTPARIAALAREARISAALEHPNIVPVHAVGVGDDGAPFMVMKRVEGTSWRELIHDPEHAAWEERHQDRVSAHVEILLAVCDALRYAHEKGVVHRDIKPDNVMVGPFGEVYLLDWGVAWTDDLEVPKDGPWLVGTPAYMAPEMVSRDGTVGTHTDVYLLGATLHEALTSRVRHEGGDVMDVLERAARSAPFDYGPSVPTELAELCNRACAAEPSQRHPSVAAFRAALLRYLSHRESAEAASTGVQHTARLEAKAREGAAEEVQRELTIARFSYQQALSSWPENPVALAGLERCLTVTARYELDLGNARAAASLLTEMRDPPRELSEAVERATAEAERRGAAHEELSRLRGALRLQGSDWRRSGSILVSGAGTCLALWLAGALGRAFEPSVVPMHVIIFVFVATLANAVGIRMFGDVVRSGLLYRQLAYSVHALSLGVAVTAAVAQVRGDTLWELAVNSCALASVLGAALALLVHPALWFTALLGCIQAVIGAHHPRYALEISGSLYLLNGIYLAAVLFPSAPWRDWVERRSRLREDDALS